MLAERGSRSGVIRRAWATAGAAVALLLAGLLVGCTLKKPQVPSMDFTLSIPVADDKTTIAEVVEEREDFLRLDEESLMVLDFSAEFERREAVGDRLQIRPVSNSFDTPIGEIRLPGQKLPEIDISLKQLLGEELPEGTVPLIPAVEIDQQVGIPLDEVQSVVIAEGGFDIALTNGLPMPLSGLKLALVDRGRNGTLVDELDLGEVAANGGTASGSFSLDGMDISGDLAIRLSGGTAEVTAVVVQGNPRLVIAATLRELVVTEATAVIPEQEFADRQVLEFPDDRIQVTRAVIREGGLVLRVRNDIPVLMEVELSLDELKKPDGTVNTFLVDQLSPGEVREVRFDLNDNEFAPDDPLELRLSYRARTVASGEPVEITSGGEIMIEAITEDLVFSRVEGVLNRVELPVAPVSVEVDFPEGLDNVELGSASMVVHLTSAVGFRSRIDLDILGTNTAGETASLQISEIFERGNPDNPISIVIAPDPEELTDFLNLLPTSVRIAPTVLLGDGTGTEVIEPSHWVQIDSVRFVASARFQIGADTQIRPDPVFRNLQDEEARRRIEGNLVDALVITRIENHLPLGVQVSLRVGSWRALARDILVTQRTAVENSMVERVLTEGWTALSEDEARSARGRILQYLTGQDIWNKLDEEDRQGIRRRIEVILDRKKGSLKRYDGARLLALIEQEDDEDAWNAVIAMLAGSLDPDYFNRSEVEAFAQRVFGNNLVYAGQVLGRDIGSTTELMGILQELEYEPDMQTEPDKRTKPDMKKGLWGKLIKYYVYKRPDLRIPREGSFAVGPAPVDDTRRVAESVDSREEITLSADEVVVFLRKGGLYTGVLIELAPTDDLVSVYGDDYVNVRAATKIFMEFNQDLVE